MSETFFTGFTAYVQDWRGMAAMTPVQVVHAREANAAVATLHEALKLAERALLSGPPNGPQKSIYGDGVIYHLDGQTCGHALQVVRAALSKVSQQTDTPQADTPQEDRT